MSTFRTAFAAALILGLPAPALAVGPEKAADPVQPVLVQLQADRSGPARIELSGRLRMLSQRIVSSACHAAAGIVPEMSAPMLRIASDEFDRILGALRFGDAKLSILSPEESGKVKAEIAAVREVWDPMYAQIQAYGNRPISIDLANSLSDQAVVLLDRTMMLYNHASSEYGNPALMLRPDAMLVDLAGRQRTFAQQISKNACLTAEGDTTVLAELKETIEVHGTGLQALRYGLPEAGILPPPTDAIAETLDEAIADWNTVEPMLARAVAGEQLTPAERQAVFVAGYGLGAKMDFLAWRYIQHSKNNS